MATPKSKSQLKRLTVQTGQVWTRVDDGYVQVTPNSPVSACEMRTLKSGATVKLLRFLDGYGIETSRSEGAAHIRTRLRFSDQAMEAIVKDYLAIKDKPIAFEMAYDVYPAKKSKKKK